MRARCSYLPEGYTVRSLSGERELLESEGAEEGDGFVSAGQRHWGAEKT